MSRLDGESDEQFRKRHVAKEPLSVSSVCVCVLLCLSTSVFLLKSLESQEPPRTDAELGTVEYLDSEIIRLAQLQGLKCT